MDQNFEIIKAMNYAYDNPEFRSKVDVDTKIVDISLKTVYLLEDAEQISMWASLSEEDQAYIMAREGLKNAKNMNDRMDRVRER